MKKKKYIILIIVTFFVGIMFVYGSSFARYVSNSIWNYYLSSKEFYFSSDNADTNIVRNVNDNWEGNSVAFNIKNTINNYVVTDYDINYTVTCSIVGDASSHARCIVYNPEDNITNDSNIYSSVLSPKKKCINTSDDGVDVGEYNQSICEINHYEWVNQVVDKRLFFDIELTDNNYVLSDIVVNISIITTSPYRKNISGDFYLHKVSPSYDKVSLKYDNYSKYDKLTISNSYLTNKCIKLIWNANDLRIQSENSEYIDSTIDENGYIKDIKVEVPGNDSVSYIFHGQGVGNTYTTSSFRVEEASGCE